MPRLTRHKLLILLDDEYQRLYEFHMSQAPKNNTIPVGGGSWMDSFFRCEGIRGCMNALRRGKSVEESLKEGVSVAAIAVKLWNSKREYQVHRWENCVEAYLVSLIQRLQNTLN